MEQNNSSDLLLVIDMQNVYTKGQEWACKGIEHASASILRLLNSQKTKQVIFTQYLATEHPDGVWKEYNKVNAAVNSDPWLNEMMPEFLRHPRGCKSRKKSPASCHLRRSSRMLRTLYCAFCH